MRCLALAVLLIAGGFARAQDVALEIKGGNTVTVMIDRIVVTKEPRLVVQSFPVSISAGSAAKSLFFWTYPATVTAVEKARGVLEITAAPKGDLTIGVKAISYDKAADDFVERHGTITFSIGEVGPVPPPPHPPPPLPSALQQALQAAYALDADPDKASKVAALADLLGNAVAYARGNGTINTAPAFAAYVHSTADAHKGIGPGAIPKTRAAIGVYLNSVLPRTGATDAAYWAKASSEYGYVALALKGVK